MKDVARDLVFKDVILDSLANITNIAQFVSFGPDLVQRFSRVRGFPPNHDFGSYRQAIRALLGQCPDGTVNIRSVDPAATKSGTFIYALEHVDEASNALGKLATNGLYTIVNETVDIEDGGVSGVVLGNVIEFAPGDTPRCVEQPGVASLERSVGISLLEIVYGFTPSLDFPRDHRVEFSIHPIRRGVRNEHTIIWELEQVKLAQPRPSIWPNRFSRFIGDKVYGLLIAHVLGFPVPRTTVVSRRVSPFTFGRPTGTGEIWIRTSPGQRQPGRFTTQSHWCDPFELVHREDPDGTEIPSVLAEDGVEAAFSGALIATQDEDPIIQGVSGKGDEFMAGKRPPDPLPPDVERSVKSVYRRVMDRLGPVGMEWVYDGQQVWVIQLQCGATTSTAHGTIVPGEVEHYYRFETKHGIAALRKLVDELRSRGVNHGIILVGDVGITSHFGDILRRSGIPSRIEYSRVANKLAE